MQALMYIGYFIHKIFIDHILVALETPEEKNEFIFV